MQWNKNNEIMDKWMKRMKLKEWNNVIYSNIDGPIEYLTKWTKAEEEKDHIISLIWGKKKKRNDTSEFSYKTETYSQT